MKLLGGELQYLLDDSLYSGFATYGANGGGVDGFAQLGVFVGWESYITPKFSTTIELHLGAAGGGRVDTGGGLLLGGEFGIRWLLDPSLFIAAEAGYLDAPDGSFSATTLGMSVGYQYSVVGLGAAVKPLIGGAHYAKQQWRFRTLHQSYLPTKKSFRKTEPMADDRRVDLIGMALDLYLNDNVYLSGQAMGAYDGGAGGYATGMFGLGYQQAIDDAFLLGVELALGSAGGGGLAVGDGLVSHAYLNGEYRFNKRFSVGLSLGRFESLDVAYQVDLLQFSVGYRFADILVR